jgi:hypothetical protein
VTYNVCLKALHEAYHDLEEARLRCREDAHALAAIRGTLDQALDLAYEQQSFGPLNNLFDEEEAALAVYEQGVAKVREAEARWSAMSVALAYEKERVTAGQLPNNRTNWFVNMFGNNPYKRIAGEVTLANIPAIMLRCNLFLYNQSSRVRYPETLDVPDVDAAHRIARRVADVFMEVVPYWDELTAEQQGRYGVVTLTSLGHIEANSAAWQFQGAAIAATFHSAMALRRWR